MEHGLSQLSSPTLAPFEIRYHGREKAFEQSWNMPRRHNRLHDNANIVSFFNTDSWIISPFCCRLLLSSSKTLVVQEISQIIEGGR